MRKISKYLLFLVVFVFMLGLSDDALAQCAMCKAAQNSSGFSSRGLNAGILYLMIIPYIAFSVLAYFWYKSSRKQKEQDKKIAQLLKNKMN